MVKDFEQLPHTADIKIRVYGNNKKELFVNALRGMFQVIGPHAPECTVQDDRLICPRLPRTHVINESGPDHVALLVNFLSEAWYLSDTHNEAYLDATISNLSDTHICAQIYGVPVTGFDVVEIKAVTYHDLDIVFVDDHWQVDIVFDI